MNFFLFSKYKYREVFIDPGRYSYIIGGFVGLWALEAVCGFNIIETGAACTGTTSSILLSQGTDILPSSKTPHHRCPLCMSLWSSYVFWLASVPKKMDNWAFVSTVELPATMMIWEESKGLVTKQGWDSLQVNIQFFICLNSPRKIKNGTLTEWM